MKVKLNSENFNAYHLKFSFSGLINDAGGSARKECAFFSVLKQKL